MNAIEIKNLNFQYPLQSKKALCNISLEIEEGSFQIICGKSGCGKSTLLSQLKSVLNSKGQKSGQVLYYGKDLEDISNEVQSSEIGFVFQNPDTQIVTDKVWHELAFGMESLGYDTDTIRLRVAEMASYFGIQKWFYRDVAELSGGQKQLLNLAAVMVMNPKVLILDEPTSQLDPIAASDFLATVRKINQELGVTIILSEHSLQEIAGWADQIIVMEEGKILTQGTIAQIGEELYRSQNDMFYAMPVPMRIFKETSGTGEVPYTVSMGHSWMLQNFIHENKKKSLELPSAVKRSKKTLSPRIALEVKNVWFRYEKESQDIVQGLDFRICEGEMVALMGGNGTGKTTTLRLLSGLLKPYQGKILVFGQRISAYKEKELYQGIYGVLPQDPTSIFVKNTVREDLQEIVGTKEAGQKQIEEIANLVRITHLLERHPYDLSGGEQQRAALAKVLLMRPRILFLDEPTKGLDIHFKKILGGILEDLKNSGVTILMVSHDIEFCAEYVERIGLFFEGKLVTDQPVRKFFAQNNFYTTVTNRMTRDFFPEAVTVQDAIENINNNVYQKIESGALSEVEYETHTKEKQRYIENQKAKTANDYMEIKLQNQRAGKKESEIDQEKMQHNPVMEFSEAKQECENKSGYRSLWYLVILFLLVPTTIWFGIRYLGDRKYLLISFLIAAYGIVPFLFLFDQKKTQARKLVVLSVLIALAVMGREAFFMLPMVKPMAAVAIIAGVGFGAESGFIVGAISMLASNFLFGQGPWTPWQMLAMGLIGLFAGVLFHSGFILHRRITLSIYGFLSVILLYGGIMNPASLIMMSYEINLKNFAAICLSGLPMDLIHAVTTFLLLLFGSNAFLTKINRIKTKYGIS